MRSRNDGGQLSDRGTVVTQGQPNEGPANPGRRSCLATVSGSFGAVGTHS